MLLDLGHHRAVAPGGELRVEGGHQGVGGDPHRGRCRVEQQPEVARMRVWTTAVPEALHREVERLQQRRSRSSRYPERAHIASTSSGGAARASPPVPDMPRSPPSGGARGPARVLSSKIRASNIGMSLPAPSPSSRSADDRAGARRSGLQCRSCRPRPSRRVSPLPAHAELRLDAGPSGPQHMDPIPYTGPLAAARAGMLKVLRDHTRGHGSCARTRSASRRSAGRRSSVSSMTSRSPSTTGRSGSTSVPPRASAGSDFGVNRKADGGDPRRLPGRRGPVRRGRPRTDHGRSRTATDRVPASPRACRSVLVPVRP